MGPSGMRRRQPRGSSSEFVVVFVFLAFVVLSFWGLCLVFSVCWLVGLPSRCLLAGEVAL